MRARGAIARPLGSRPLPAAAERAEQVDLRLGDRGIRRRQRGLGIGKGALGVEQVERVDVALGLARAGDPRRRLGFVECRLERGTPLERAAVIGQRRLGLLQRGQHRAVEGGERLAAIGFGGSDAGTCRRRVHRPVDQSADQPAQRSRTEDVAEVVAGRSPRPAQRDARVQIRGGDADARSGGREPALCRAHVRPTGEQRRAVADRDRLVEPQRGVAFARLGGQLGRRLADQRGEAEQRRIALRGERGHVRLALVAQRRDAGDVEPRRQADIAAALGEVDRLVEQCHDPLGHRQPLGRGHRISIGARGIGRDDHADRIGIGLRRRDVAARRLDVARDAAEQVDLIGDVEPGIDLPVFLTDADRALPHRQAAVIGAGTRGRLGQPVRSCAA